MMIPIARILLEVTGPEDTIYGISTSVGFIGAWQRFGKEAPQW